MLLPLHSRETTRYAGRISRYVIVALAVMIVFPVLAFAETAEPRDDSREAGYTAPQPSGTPTVALSIQAATPTTAPTATHSPTAIPPTATSRPPTATPDPLAGLTIVGRGPAAFYDPNYDRGGWDAIIRTHIRFGQTDSATFAWSSQGYYCVHPDYHLGNILTLQNPRTGVMIRCTVADVVDRGDEALWRSRWKVEMSYAAFTALALNRDENIVTVWVMKS